ncbi:hypothetical protein COF68_05215 [Bacillus toyonensis]|uniref:SAP domain-containing protein n=1 Tax=Bacillus toyonensis TaxID=155322 RepID=UPI000BFB9FC8|nr:SAP domain-containing protein [Bacillus toyonensis]PHE64244.1 hypothetical protein COF68_05215 [Bacillus toyonensis]
MKPKLTSDMSIDDFRNHNWSKAELQVFCKEHSISASDKKLDIMERVDVFILTGYIMKHAKKPRGKLEVATVRGIRQLFK